MKIIIKRGKESSIERGHPWIFSGAIHKIIGSSNNGDVAEVFGDQDQFLARGHYQNGTIAVRILTRDEHIHLNQDFWNERLRVALALRKKLGLFRPGNSICRLVHGEGDMLPGLIIDWFNGVAVIQCHSIGMFRSMDFIKNALLKNLEDSLVAIYSKSADTLPVEMSAVNGYIYGTSSTPHIAEEYGHQFSIDWVNGQKTGFFIDQRENRKLLGEYSIGKKVLNTFCYSGGFSIYAINAGAALVHSVDSSKKAIDLTNKNVELLDSKTSIHESFAMDTFQFLEKCKEDYDIIILDPPAFAKHINAKHNAVQGYKRLNCEAIKMIKPGGIIFTFSCSQVVDRQLFERTIMSAAIQAGRNVRIMHHLSQPADHAPSAFHPEGEYLKGLVLFVE